MPLADSWLRHRPRDPAAAGRRDELRRTLDIFPLEYTAISATLTDRSRTQSRSTATAPDPADLRRALETQAKSHLIHLREGFLESRGEVQAVAALIVASAAPFRTLLASIARLLDGDRTATRVGRCGARRRGAGPSRHARGNGPGGVRGGIVGPRDDYRSRRPARALRRWPSSAPGSTWTNGVNDEGRMPNAEGVNVEGRMANAEALSGICAFGICAFGIRHWPFGIDTGQRRQHPHADRARQRFRARHRQLEPHRTGPPDPRPSAGHGR